VLPYRILVGYKKTRPSVKKCDCWPAHKKQVIHVEKRELVVVLF